MLPSIFLGIVIAFADPYPHLPPITDLNAFPCKEYCTRQRVFAGRYISNMKFRMVVEPHREREITQVLEVAQWHYRCWDVLEDAATTGFGFMTRREKLEILKNLLGCLRYRFADMPDPVPIEYFVLN